MCLFAAVRTGCCAALAIDGLFSVQFLNFLMSVLEAIITKIQFYAAIVCVGELVDFANLQTALNASVTIGLCEFITHATLFKAADCLF